MSRPRQSSLTKRLFPAFFGLVALVGAYLLMQNGLSQLAEARQMERLPYTPLAGVTRGAYMVSGQVEDAGSTVKTPYTGTPAVYFRYALEEEYWDSDGDRRTRTLDSGQQAVPFLMRDNTNSITITPDSASDIQWRIKRSFQRREGDRIYSEWALSPGDTVNVLGRYDSANQQLVFSSLEPFNLSPQISSRPFDIAGGDRLLDVAIRVSAATGLLALGVALLLTFARVHRFWVFVVTMLVAVTGTLSVMGAAKLSKEWSSVTTLYQARQQGAQAAPDNLPARADVAALKQLIQRNTSGWLDNWMYQRTTASSSTEVALDAATQALTQQLVQSKPQTRYQHTWIGWGLSVAAAVAALLLLIAAIRKVKFKRLIEAVPNSSTAGLSYGLAEVEGAVTPHETFGTLTAPLRNEPCVAFNYRIEENRGSDKDNQWRTIEHQHEHLPFWLEDTYGRALIDPDGAKIAFPERHSETRGNQRHTVRLLPPGSRLFCLGFAGLSHEHPERLTLQADKDSPFLLSAKTEAEIVESSGSKGFLITAVALALALFSATSLLAADGNFSPGNLLAAAVVVPAMLCLYLGILHYNDMIFLKRRVDRAEANIDTILQQRYDLWPSLETAVKALLAHEKHLQKTLASLRAANPSDLAGTQQTGNRLAREKQFTAALQARIEDYPDLKSHPVVSRFMDIMAETENYLALLRNSQTDSATLYNTRIQSFPDLILARLFGFREVSPLGKTTDSA
ncbi:LemA family protein [Marinobacter sp. chi1]|uniref:RING-type E3 ubiquitin transferase n=1 Tax=Marinobacter suaedae TaxID=3057675 RepID=A0ABT8VX78_9GAMM|nr:LemA family protein [Marinobacter sp. chi1]MDO3720595.1 LemA family protein [Marinobacter sp. chi1]